ncbi:MAG: APC family permease, partial [Clostridium sp.]|uniref:APC family permease n=1 Tax=Clostridium sp. TaxID=1506 RepID=UPI003EE47E14
IMTYAICIIASATMAVGFVTALSVFIPSVATGITKVIVIIALLVLLAIMNFAGVNLSKIIINVSTIGKIIPFIIFIAVGIFFIKGGNFTPVFPHGTYTHGSFGAAALLIFFSFTGFESIALAAEDMDNPSKNVPKAIIIVMLLVSVIYMLIQAISIGVLGPKLASDLTPVATASSQMLGPFGGILVSLGILVSIIGINATQSFLTPRLGMALANDGLLPRAMAKQSKRGVPYISVIVSTIITIPIALSGSFTHLALISAISRFAQYLPTCLAVLVLRKKRPDLQGSFKIPFGPTIPVIAIVVSLWILFQSTPEQIIWGLGGLIVAIPLYFFMNFYNKKYENNKIEK